MVAATPHANEPRAQQASASADQDLYMSSRGTNSVRRYDGQTGAYLGDFVSTGSGGLSTTQEVLFGPDGHLYVSGRGNKHIKKYDGLTGEFMGDFTSGFDLDEPTKMSFGPDGRLYVSQWGETTQRIARFDASTGAFVDQIPDSNLDQPMDHAWNADGTLHVVSFGSRDVRRFNSDGNEIDVFVGGSNLQAPVNLWFDEAGDMLVVDWGAGSVKQFDGQTGSRKFNYITGLTRAEGFALGPDGYVYVCDWQLNRVNKYDAETGDFVETFATGGLNPNSIAFGPSTGSTGILDNDELRNDARLLENYPNPFSTTTTISFTLIEPGRARLSIYDLLGRELSAPLDRSMGSGTHEVTLSADGLPPGVYMARLRSASVDRYRTLVVLR